MCHTLSPLIYYIYWGYCVGINDGAAVVVLVSGDHLSVSPVPPLGRIVSWGQAGVDPSVMGMGPVPAVKSAVS